MNKLISIAIMVVLVLAVGSLTASAGEKPAGTATHSKEFEKMKDLLGVWEGTTDMGRGKETIKATYELTSGGSAILERLFAGSPQEMVTVYYDSHGKLTLTHYCALGNQPRMQLKSSGDNALSFVLAKKHHGLSSIKELHMHALTISFDSKDSITHTWVLYDKGKKKSEHLFKLSRVK